MVQQPRKDERRDALKCDVVESREPAAVTPSVQRFLPARQVMEARCCFVFS